MTQGDAGPAERSAEPPSDTRSPEEAVDWLRQVTGAIGRRIVGYRDVVRALLIALLAEGHVLLEGVPGLAKTQLIRAFSRTLRLSFRRIQFTPDMLPTDILGTTILQPKEPSFVFRPGPIFSNVILADEINRAPPKVQSALLEAMQERQVTLDGVTRPLPAPFLVIATQNPIEHEGTYPLPEAELDRFLFRWIMGYPSGDDEVEILRSRAHVQEPEEVPPVLDPATIERLRRLRRDVHLHDDLYRYLAAVVRRTRADHRLLVGASPRASVQFLFAVQAAALLEGRSYVVPDDVRELAFSVFNHRVLVRPEVLGQSVGIAEADGTVALLARILGEDLDDVEIPR